MATTPDPNFIICYVTNVASSTAFYADLLGRPPVESAPNFAMFALSSGVMLGLWALSDVKPPSMTLGGGGEICITVANVKTVDSLCEEWLGRGMTIIQQPTKMDFGYTFVACDPDGHRIRVFVPTRP